MGHHDKFFKQVFSDKNHAVDFVRTVLPPDLRDGLDFGSFQDEKDSFVGEELSEYFSDLVYSCRLKDTKIRIALLFEHKSYVDHDLPFQLIRYMSGIWDNCQRQKKERTPVIPIVIYHGLEHWTPGPLSSCFKSLDPSVRPFVPDSEYLFIHLSRWPDELIRETLFSLASLKLSVLVLKHIFQPDVLKVHLRDYFEVGAALFEAEEGMQFLKIMIEYIFKTTEIQPEYVAETMGSVSIQGKELAMTTAERLMNEGHMRGRMEGREEGIYLEKFQTIMKLRKINMKPEQIAEITNLTPEKIEAVFAAGDKGLDLLMPKDGSLN
jgi:predicted transposase/invertase (TIGR01784 family)